MLTHVHKVIHLVVGTFEQGLETSLAECLPVECEQSDGATGALYRKDGSRCKCPDAGLGRTGASSQWKHEDAGVVLPPNAGSLSDRTLMGCVRSC